ATPRGRMLPPARASGVARATERSACANRLLRARGASRRSTAFVAKAADRPTASAQNRIRPADRRSPATAIDEGDSHPL
ncbi:MAG: hypothetical protein ABSC37_03750, partial [Xanthobacteraceae bacterium]